MTHLNKILISLSILLWFSISAFSQSHLSLDDVSFTFDGGDNLLQNGDFSDGSVHWNTWDDEISGNRILDEQDYYSAPASYKFINGSTNGALRTFYTLNNESIDWEFGQIDPYAPSISIWFDVAEGTNVTLSYRYKGVVGSAFILGLDDAGTWTNLTESGSNYSWEWTFDSKSVVVPDTIIAVGIQFDSYYNGSSSTNEILNENLVSIYPNPSTGLFTINANSTNSDVISLEITGINGQKVYSDILYNSGKAKPIDLTDIKKGIYFIKTQGSDFIEVKKLIIK